MGVERVINGMEVFAPTSAYFPSGFQLCTQVGITHKKHFFSLCIAL